MRGEVLNFDEATGTGLISGDDGLRYEFSVSSLIGATAIQAGQRVDFVPEDGMAIQIMVLAGAAQPQAAAGLTSAGVGGPGAIDWKHLLLQFDGRIRRSHFWIGWLVLFGAGFVLGFIPFLGAIISIALIWPNLAVTVKRLHDMGQTGWLAAIPFAVSLVGGIGAAVMIGVGAIAGSQSSYYDESPAAAFAIMGPAFGIIALVMLVCLGFLLWIGLTPSQPGTNKYGPNPKGE